VFPYVFQAHHLVVDVRVPGNFIKGPISQRTLVQRRKGALERSLIPKPSSTPVKNAEGSQPKAEPATGQGALAPATPAKEGGSSSPPKAAKATRSRPSRRKKPTTATALTGDKNVPLTQGNQVEGGRNNLCASCMLPSCLGLRCDPVLCFYITLLSGS